jgi:hypothetical protein
MTQTTSIHSNLYQPIELDIINRHERKVWTKPEIREINFNKTANGGTTNIDSIDKS